MKKVLILTVTAGNGHNAIAKSVKEECEKHGMEAKVVDVLKDLKASKSYIWVNDRGYALACTFLCKTFNRFFRYYLKKDPKKFYKNTVQKGPKKLYGKFLKMIMDYQPDAIFCSHYIPAVVLTNLRRKYKIPAQISSLLTDYTLSPFWEAGNGIDYIVIPNEDFAECLIEKGFTQKQFLPYGFPVNSKFAKEIDKKEARRMIGVDENKFTIFVMFGGGMWSGNYKIAKNLIKHFDRKGVQVVIANGKDEKGRKKIDKLKARNLEVYNWGFCNNVDVIMSAADVIVGKAGSSSVTEAVNKKLPLLCASYIPQQEQNNIEFIEKLGAGVQFKNKKQLIEILSDLIEHPEKLEKMSENYDKIRKPNALKDLATFIEKAPEVKYEDVEIDYSKVNSNMKKALKECGKAAKAEKKAKKK